MLKKLTLVLVAFTSFQVFAFEQYQMTTVEYVQTMLWTEGLSAQDEEAKDTIRQIILPEEIAVPLDLLDA